MTIHDKRRSPWAVSAQQQHRGHEETWLQRLGRANDDLHAAKKARHADSVAAAQERVQAAVDAARDAGANWTQIGNALDIRRGNAYQQFRRRPKTS